MEASLRAINPDLFTVGCCAFHLSQANGMCGSEFPSVMYGLEGPRVNVLMLSCNCNYYQHFQGREGRHSYCGKSNINKRESLEDESSFAHCSILIIFNNPSILLIFVCFFHLSCSLFLSLTHTHIYTLFSELF